MCSCSCAYRNAYEEHPPKRAILDIGAFPGGAADLPPILAGGRRNGGRKREGKVGKGGQGEVGGRGGKSEMWKRGRRKR